MANQTQVVMPDSVDVVPTQYEIPYELKRLETLVTDLSDSLAKLEARIVSVMANSSSPQVNDPPEGKAPESETGLGGWLRKQNDRLDTLITVVQLFTAKVRL